MSKTTTVLSLLLLSLALLLPAPARAQAEKQTAYGLLLDNTGSLRSQLPDVLALGQGVVRRVRPRGPVALYNFTNDGNERGAVVTEGAVWGGAEPDLQRYIDSLRTVPGQTTLFDAISFLTQDLLAKAAADKNAYADKAIILITDGEERLYSRGHGQPSTGNVKAGDRSKKEKELIRALREGGVKVYAVGLVRELDAQRGFISKSRRQTAEEFLRKLTQETGGRVVFSKSKKAEVESLLDELLQRGCGGRGFW
jgi:hypothetical protein